MLWPLRYAILGRTNRQVDRFVDITGLVEVMTWKRLPGTILDSLLDKAAMKLLHVSALVWLSGALLTGSSFAQTEPSPTTPIQFPLEQIEFFESRIRPLLVEHCYECHSQKAEFVEAGLLVDSRQGLLQGGDSGPAIDLKAPEKSLFLSAIQYGDLFQMPPTGKLPQERIDLFAKWLAMGAPWPADQQTSAVKAAEFDLAKRKSEHWCWQAPQSVTPPSVSNQAWSRNPIDPFVLDRLNRAGLAPNPPASRAALIRRAYFDLIGLPPSPQQVEAFVKDPDERAFEKVIDELLASPHFGERWARHWMDLFRYAETCGHEFDYPIKNAYRYRDYLIRAFNADVPYDQFVTEHVAGDLLKQPRLHPEDRTNESILATGFWFLGEAVHAPVDVKGDEAARIDNQIDIMTKSFLGLTVACARCHDHKFDAISAEDYYALSGFLQSSHRQEVLLDPHQKIAAKVREISELVQESNRQAAGVIRSFQESDPEELAKHLVSAVEGILAGSESEKTEGKASPNTKGVGSFFSKPIIGIASLRSDRESLRFTSTPFSGKEFRPVEANVTNNHHRTARAVPQKKLWADALAVEVPVSHPMFALQQLANELARNPKGGFESARKTVLKKLRNQVTVAEKTRSSAIRFADFSPENYRQWYETGFAFGGSATDSYSIETAGANLLSTPGMAHSGRLGTHQYGVLRSPTFTIEHSKIHYRMLAEKVQIRLIIDGFVMDVHNALLFSDMSFTHDSQGKMAWRTQAGDLSKYLGHRAHIEIIDHGDGFAAVDEIWFSNDKAPADFPSPLAEPIVTQAQSLDDLCFGFATAIVGDGDDKLADQMEVVNWLNHHGLSLSGEQDNWKRLIERKEQIRTIQADTPQPQMALGMTDGSAENEYLFIRGNHRNRGPQVSRDLIAALKRESDPAFDRGQGSGRLYLAERMVDPANPLTARVMVNRVWHHLLGRGLVGSVDNFGVLGELPTHPELLDFLALQFSRTGWSTKALIKQIMTSQTYQMSSTPNPTNEEVDPRNQLYHRFPIKRLQGEAIRDAMLAISGDLDPTFFGPSVPVHLTEFMQGRGRPGSSGPLNGNGRRSIYTEVRRNFLSPMMLAFDTPIPFNATGRRTESNVPAQALVLMNSPFMIEQAQKWAARLIQEQPDPRQRIARIYQQAFGRNPSEREIDQGIEFLAVQAKELKVDSTRVAENQELWADYCHVILNGKEFIYLR